MTEIKRLLLALLIGISAVFWVSCTPAHESLGGVDVTWDRVGRRERMRVGCSDVYGKQPLYSPNSCYRPVNISVRIQNSNSYAIDSIQFACHPIKLELGPVPPHQTKIDTATVPGSASGNWNEVVEVEEHCYVVSIAWVVGNQKHVLKNR